MDSSNGLTRAARRNPLARLAPNQSEELLVFLQFKVCRPRQAFVGDDAFSIDDPERPVVKPSMGMLRFSESLPFPQCFA